MISFSGRDEQQGGRVRADPVEAMATVVLGVHWLGPCPGVRAPLGCGYGPEVISPNPK
jgi:hypothetical protein